MFVLSLEDVRKREVSILWLILLGGIAILDICIVLCAQGSFVRCWNASPGMEMKAADMLLLRLLAGGFPGGLMLLCAFAFGRHIGCGDGWTLVVLGVSCGGSMICGILFYTCVCMLFGCIVLLAQKRKRVRSIPFLPFLFSGYLIFGVINVI